MADHTTYHNQYVQPFNDQRETKRQNKEFQNKLKENFEDSSKYFVSYDLIEIKNKGPRFDNHQHPIKHTVVGEITLKDLKNNGKETGIKNQNHVELVKKRNMFPKVGSTNTINEKRINSSKSRVSNHELDAAYENAILRIQNNKESNNKFLEKVPNLVQNQLLNQEKALANEEIKKIESSKIERILSSKSKKSIDQLLINKLYDYRFKKLAREESESNRPLDERYGTNSWYVGLRRPSNFTGTRFAYVNIGSIERPIWSSIKEVVIKDKEKIKNNIFRSTTLNEKFYKVDSNALFTPFEVSGHDLLRRELKSAKDIKGEKVLFSNEEIQNKFQSSEVIIENFDSKSKLIKK